MNTHALYVASIWLHLTAMAVWMGGMLFMAAVVLPALRRDRPAAVGEFLVRATTRLRVVGWVCLAVLGFTGWAQLEFRGIAWNANVVVVSKIAVYFALLAISVLHDFWLGPRASLAMRDDPGSSATIRVRQVAMRMGRMTAVLALLAATLGVFIARGTPW